MVKEKRTPSIFIQACLFISLFMFFSCSSSSGGHSDSQGRNGSIAFSLQAASDESSGSQYNKASAGVTGTVQSEAVLDCDGLGIVSVEAYVYDENQELIARGGPWDCHAGEGIIYGVKQGSNRTTLIFLKNGNNQVRYRGRSSALTVVAGQTTDAGVIEVLEAEDENQLPVPSNDHATVNRGGTVSILDSGFTSLLRNDLDPDGQSLVVSASPVNGPVNGAVMLQPDGTFSYTHDGSASTADSFTYRVSDGNGGTATALVSITVISGQNVNPALSEGFVSPERGDVATTYTYSVRYEDPDGNSPSAVLVSIDGSAHAMEFFSGSSAQGVYLFRTTLSPGEHAYSFSCSDGHGGSAVFPASGQRTGPSVFLVNPDPTASDDQVTVNRGGVVSVLDSGFTSVLANDVAPTGLSLSAGTKPVREPSHGSLTLSADGTFSYRHDGGESTADSFVYRISDSNGGWDTATVNITVIPGENHDPVLSEGGVSPESGDTATIFSYAVHYFDEDGHRPVAIHVSIDNVPHAMELVEGPACDGIYRYRTTLARGAHTYSFACTDGHGGFAPPVDSEIYSGPVVYPENRKPTASDDRAIVSRGDAVSILDSGFASLLSNDSDPDGQALSVHTTPVSGPSHGTLVLNEDGTFSYSHDGGDSTADSFTYRVSDGNGATDTAIVSITVLSGSSHDPVLTDPELYPRQGDTEDVFTFSIRYFDADGDAPLLGYVIIDGTPHPMNLYAGSGFNGVYVFKTSLSAGSHEYWFAFIDATGDSCRYPSSGTLRGSEIYEAVARYYVAPAPIGDDRNDGSILSPFGSIGHALETAGGTPYEPVIIRIAAGTYFENITLAPWESLEGGWDSDFSLRWDFSRDGITPLSEYETIIEGRETGRCITIDGAEGVGIDGVTVRGGIQPGVYTAGGISRIPVHPTSSIAVLRIAVSREVPMCIVPRMLSNPAAHRSSATSSPTILQAEQKPPMAAGSITCHRLR